MSIAYMILLSSTILALSGIVRIKKTNKPPGETTQLDEDEDPYLRNPLLENERVGVGDEDMYLTNEPFWQRKRKGLCCS